MWKKHPIAWTIIALGLFVVLVGLLATPVNAGGVESPIAQEPSPRPGWSATLTPAATVAPTAAPEPTATSAPSSPSEPQPTVSPEVTLLPETGRVLPFGLVLAGLALIGTGSALLVAHRGQSQGRDQE